jgi:hypothetical protein
LGNYDASFIKIPDDLLQDNVSNLISFIVDMVYPNINTEQITPLYFRETAVMTTKNEIVIKINNYVLDIVPDDKHIYLSTDFVCTVLGDTCCN